MMDLFQKKTFLFFLEGGNHQYKLLKAFLKQLLREFLEEPLDKRLGEAFEKLLDKKSSSRTPI